MHWLHGIHWVQWLRHGSFTAGIVGFAMIFFVSFVPVLPIPLIAGVLGHILPIWIAFAVSWTSAVVAAIIKYWVLRYLLRDTAQKWLVKSRWATRIAGLLEKNGFLTVLLARLIPVIPSAAINLASSVIRISDSSFILATAIGKIPIMLTFVMAGHSIRKNPWFSFVIIGVYLLIVVIASLYLRRSMRDDSSSKPK